MLSNLAPVELDALNGSLDLIHHNFLTEGVPQTTCLIFIIRCRENSESFIQVGQSAQ